MPSFISHFDNKFTLKRKGFFALGAVAFAVLWIIGWLIFPMEFFSLFFDFTAGSYVTLALMSAFVTIVFNWLFTLISRQNISVTFTFTSNLVFQIGMFFLFAAFRYSIPYLWIITAVVHLILTILIFIFSKPIELTSVKRVKNKKAPIGNKLKIVLGLAYSLLGDGLYLLINYIFIRLAYGQIE